MDAAMRKVNVVRVRPDRLVKRHGFRGVCGFELRLFGEEAEESRTLWHGH